jgi:hypothetical protein
MDTGTNELTAEPDKIYLSVKNDDEVEWVPVGGEVDIEFKGDSPFKSKKFHAAKGGSVRSGKSERGKVRQDAYKYDIIFRAFDKSGKSTGDKPKDPEVIVEP